MTLGLFTVVFSWEGILLAALAIPGLDWLDAEWLLEAFQTWLGPFMILAVAAVIFIETAVIVLSFLPGDSLLFTLGLLTATGYITTPLWVTALLLFAAAFAGDQMAFTLGRRLGPKIFAREKSKFFNPENVAKTEQFFAKHGGKAIILARFLPVFRAFVPAAAGVGNMTHRHFALYNSIGALLWTTGLVCLGFFLGQIPFVQKYSEYFIIGIILISGIPILREIWLNTRKSLKKKKAQKSDLS